MGEVCSTDDRTKKLTEDGETEEITNLVIYHIGLTLGLAVRDIDIMTAGEIIDLAYYRANQESSRKDKKESGRKATQADYDSF